MTTFLRCAYGVLLAGCAATAMNSCQSHPPFEVEDIVVEYNLSVEENPKGTLDVRNLDDFGPRVSDVYTGMRMAFTATSDANVSEEELESLVERLEAKGRGFTAIQPASPTALERVLYFAHNLRDRRVKMLFSGKKHITVDDEPSDSSFLLLPGAHGFAIKGSKIRHVFKPLESDAHAQPKDGVPEGKEEQITLPTSR